VSAGTRTDEGTRAAAQGDEEHLAERESREERAALRTALPPLAAKRRRMWLVGLVLLGLVQAAMAGLSAWALVSLQNGSTPRIQLAGLLLAVTAIAASAAFRVRERALAEQLGQDYVGQIRHRLIQAALGGETGPSLGVTVARTTNDLSALKNWVALGVAPLVVAVPMLAGTCVVLAVLDPILGLAIAIPVALLGLGALLLGPAVQRKTRALRRRRGMMASRVAETVTAADGIRSAGGVGRELKHVDRSTGKLADAAVERAEASGMLRALGIACAGLAGVLVVAAGIHGGVAPAGMVAALAVVGITTSSFSDLGRIADYRQSFLAARAVVGPVLLRGARSEEELAALRRTARRAEAPPGAEGDGTVLVRGVELGDGQELSGFRAEPGTRLRVRSADPDRANAALVAIVEPLRSGADVWIGGEALAGLGAKQARGRVGFANAWPTFERGSVSRAARYRRPDLPVAEAEEVLARVGLDTGTWEEGLSTRIRRGGEPLGRQDRVRLAIGRALMGTPELLVLDRVSEGLGAEARQRVAEVLAAYPGVVLVHDEGLPLDPGEWDELSLDH
jgi:ABC-type multidrug transport system fused ATPase/permease subunit